MRSDSRPLLMTSFVVLALLSSSSARAEIIGHWSFDGCTTTDATTPASDLIAHNAPTCVTGVIGQAWQLDGISQFLERGFDTDFEPRLRPWTVAAWVKSTASGRYQTIVSWYRCGANPACSPTDAAFYELALDHGNPYWMARDDAGSTHILEDTTSVADGDWHLLVGTMNANTDSVKLYVDGALRMVGSGPLGNTTAGSVAIPLQVGRHFRTGWGVPVAHFAGSIDDVRIHDHELSADQVAQLHVGSVTAVGPESSLDSEILRLGVNPVRGGRLTVAFALPGTGPATLELFDLLGRSVARTGGLSGAARQQVEMGSDLTPGIYLIRLTQGTRSYSRRVAVLD